MRKVLFFLCAAALLQSTAFATVIGTWAKTTSGLDDIWTLTATPNAGETMVVLDIAVWDTAASSPFLFNGTTTASTLDLNSHFLYQKNHRVGANTIDDATISGDGVDADDLYGSVGFYAGGLYDTTAGTGLPGPKAATKVLQLVVPTASDQFSINYNLGSGLNGLGMADADGAGGTLGLDHGIWIAQGVAHQIVFVPVPEPGTFALLGCGLFGLLAYAWRKRK